MVFYSLLIVISLQNIVEYGIYEAGSGYSLINKTSPAAGTLGTYTCANPLPLHYLT